MGSPRYTTHTTGTTFETPEWLWNMKKARITCTSTTAITTAPKHSSKHSTSTKYDSVTQKMRAHLKRQTKFRLYGDLSDILGFGNITSDADHTVTLPANSVVDLRRGFESLYVYSSMVEPRVVGDKIVPLLRIVPITGRHGEMVTTRFDHVQYIPVMSREFGTIETEIRDDTGRPVPFERGKVTVTLHFRRRSTGLFR